MNIKKTGRGGRRQSMGKFASDALKALRIAVAKAIEEHRRGGDPIVVWENGRVKWIPASDIPPQKIPKRYARGLGSRRFPAW